MSPIFKCLICRKDIERSTKSFWSKKGHLLCSTCLDDIDKKRSELEKNLEEEIEIAEKEIQNLNKSSAENIKKIATETSSGLIKQLIGEEINKENISSIVNDLTNNSKENRKNV